MKQDHTILNWTIQEYCGQTVYWLDNETTITNKDDLKVGYQFIAGSWIFTAQQYENGQLYGENTNMTCILEFGKDDRNCWVAAGFIGKRGLIFRD